MTKRKPVLVLFIIAAVFYLAALALLLLASFGILKGGAVPAFADLNKGILGLFQGQQMLINIVSIAVTAVLFILIPLIVHLVRKQASVTVVLLLGALVALYTEILYMVYFNSIDLEALVKEADPQKILDKLSLFVLIGVVALGIGGVLELVTFIVDMAIRVRREPQAVPTAQEMREEPKAEEPTPAPAPAEEPKAEEPAPAPAPEEEEEEEEEEPQGFEVAEEEPEGFAVAEEEEEEKPAPKKAPAKKPAPKKEEKKPAKKPEPKKEPAKKAPAKKEEAKKPAARETQTIKKPATRETTTIKKPARETQTMKKPEVLTNEEGKQFVKAYHVSQRKELKKWQVKGAGSDKAIKLFDTQKEAIEYANQLSANNGAAVRVHSRAGKMRKA